MTNNIWRLVYYKNIRTKKVPVKEYIYQFNEKTRAKIRAYLEILKRSEGKLDQPYSKYIAYGIRELRVDYEKKYHRIFYFLVVGKKILLLHAFIKKTTKTPKQEIKRAVENKNDYLNKPQKYES